MRLLERLGHEVVFPERQTCCGQLHANSGYRPDALALARRVVEIFEPFEAVVSPSSSCVGAIRELYPLLAQEAGTRPSRSAPGRSRRGCSSCRSFSSSGSD